MRPISLSGLYPVPSAMIGLFGGTFDPIHFGHLRPARAAYQRLGLSCLRFILAARPPHRQPPQASVTQRLHMLKLAIQHESGFVVDERELLRQGPSYTVDSLLSLRQEFPQDSLCLLLGADAFLGLEAWHQWQRIPQLTHIVVLHRPGWELAAHEQAWPQGMKQRLVEDKQQLSRTDGGSLLLLELEPVDISATAIRQAVAAGDDITHSVPPAVAEFIKEQGLYRSGWE